MPNQPESFPRRFWSWLLQVDRIIRGDATRPSTLATGEIQFPLGGVTLALVALACAYGFCLGFFALFNRVEGPSFAQLLSVTVKMPLLFFLTLLVTFPSLYVFNALVGSRLTLRALVRLLVASMGVTLSVLAAFGPVVAFFSISTDSYYFMSLLNLVFCAVSGALGLMFLFQTLNRITAAMAVAQLETLEPQPADNPDEDGAEPAKEEDAAEAAAPEQPEHVERMSPSPEEPGALDRIAGHILGRHVKPVFYCWVALFALVGGQMSWILRPFLGDPNKPVQLFRPRESSFFQAVGKLIIELFGG